MDHTGTATGVVSGQIIGGLDEYYRRVRAFTRRLCRSLTARTYDIECVRAAPFPGAAPRVETSRAERAPSVRMSGVETRQDDAWWQFTGIRLAQDAGGTR